jgi:hypothetical protein
MNSELDMNLIFQHIDQLLLPPTPQPDIATLLVYGEVGKVMRGTNLVWRDLFVA